MVGLAIGQLVFGPLSDKYGRRSPLLAAMVLFLISTVGVSSPGTYHSLCCGVLCRELPEREEL